MKTRTTEGIAHARRGETDRYWVIEYNTAREHRWERVDGATHHVASYKDQLEIIPLKDAPLPTRTIPMHMIAEITAYPEIEAP